MALIIERKWPTDLAGKPVMERFEHSAEGMRLVLSRRWAAEGPIACVIGHNPSTASGLTEDPTTLWLNAWFQQAGFAGYTIVNLYPWRSPDPRDVYRKVEEISEGDWGLRDNLHLRNLPKVVEAAKSAGQVFACWGAIARDLDWIEHVVEQIQFDAEPWPAIWCWGLTKAGAPKHPMARGKHRIPKDQEPILWRAAP